GASRVGRGMAHTATLARSMIVHSTSRNGTIVHLHIQSRHPVSANRVGPDTSPRPTREARPHAGGGGGKECAARHERSNDWPQGGAAPITRTSARRRLRSRWTYLCQQ